MTKHRVRRHRLAHPGVKLLRLADGRHVARFKDPLSRRWLQQSMDALGLTRAEARLQWAIAKSKDLLSLRAKVAAGDILAAPENLSNAVSDFLSGYDNPKTLEAFGLALRRLVAWAAEHGAQNVQDLRPSMLAAYRDHATKAPVARPARGGRRGERRPAARRRAPKSINNDLGATKTFLAWARRRGLLPHVTADAIQDGLRPVRLPREAIAFLRPKDLRALLEASLRHDAETFAMTRAEHAGEGETGTTPRHPPIAPFLLSAVLTGMRFGELAGLRWAEADLEGGRIGLPASRVKTGHARSVTLAETPGMLDLLRALSLRRRGELVFAIRRDVAESCRRRLVSRFGAPSFTWHELRRTCGTLLTNAPGIYGGASAFLSAKRLGHGVQVAEAHYAGALPGLPHEAKTLEEAAGIKDLAAQVVARAGGVRRVAEAQARAE